eukprot:scaffold58778_cov33-Tisochrysis_lutea.AAC.3
MEVVAADGSATLLIAVARESVNVADADLVVVDGKHWLGPPPPPSERHRNDHSCEGCKCHRTPIHGAEGSTAQEPPPGRACRRTAPAPCGGRPWRSPASSAFPSSVAAVRDSTREREEMPVYL